MSWNWKKALLFTGLVVVALAIFNGWVLAQEHTAPAGGGTAPAAAQEEGEKKATSFLYVITIGSSWIGLVIWIGSVMLVALTIINFIVIRRDRLVPPGLEAQVAQLIQKRRLDQLVTLVRSTDSYSTRILLKGLSEIQGGYSAMKQAMEEAGGEETVRLNQRISWLAMLTQLTPMLGLFGTVQGMISAFAHLSTQAGSPNAQQLASDINLALGTTFLGLMVAQPGLVVYAIFRSRVVLYSLEIGGFCEQFLRMLRRTYGNQLAQAAAAIPASTTQAPQTAPAGKAAAPQATIPQVTPLPETGQPPMIQPLPPQGAEGGTE